APVVAAISGQVSLVAVVANLLVAPVVAPITLLGVLTALSSTVNDSAAELVAWLAGPAVGWLVAVAHWGAGVPAGALAWPAGLWGAALLTAVLVAVLCVARWRRLRLVVLAVLAGAALVIVPTRFTTPGWPPAGWVAVACDVGQGDALVLATGYPGHA